MYDNGYDDIDFWKSDKFRNENSNEGVNIYENVFKENIL